MMYQDDINKLKEFVWSIGDDIGFVVSNLYEINPEVKKIDLPIDRAWVEIKPRFEEIVNNLEGKGLFDTRKMEEELVNRGLVGIQLELKLRFYRYYSEETKRVWIEFTASSEEKKKEKRGILGKVLGKLLRIIDRILESLGFIPGTDAVREVKGILEELVP